MLVVPETLTVEVVKFASEISSGKALVLVDIVPEPDAIKLSCWDNVSRACQRCGGSAVKGYRIWWIPGILIEAQAHVVWQQEKGRLLDVTPSEDGERVCAFVADPAMKERPGTDFVPSRHKNLCGEPCVDEFIRCSAVVAAWQDCQNTMQLDLPEPPELPKKCEALGKMAQILERMQSKPPR